MTEITTKQMLEEECQEPCECCGKPTQIIQFSNTCHPEAPLECCYDKPSGEIRLYCMECDEVTHRFKLQDQFPRN
jgi:hypothetical protein